MLRTVVGLEGDTPTHFYLGSIKDILKREMNELLFRAESFVISIFCGNTDQTMALERGELVP